MQFLHADRYPRASSASLARRLLKHVAAGGDVIRRPKRGLVVLIYHRVGGATSSLVDLPVGLFDAQMAELAATERVLPLGLGLERLASSPATGPDNPVAAHDPEPAVVGKVVVSFDDGTADFVENALPVLARHGLPAVLYLATGHVEDARPFPGGGRPVSWAALADALSTGLVTIGSHTHSHLLLDRVDGRTALEELDRSIDLIGDRLGIDAEHFAYPKAMAGSPQADRAVRARFSSGAVAGTRANVVGRTDPYLLARSPVQVSDGMRWFRQKADGGMTLEDSMRHAANRRRYRDAKR